LLRVFAGDWVEGMLKRLGMTEDKPLESPMIARRLQATQGAVARRALTDRQAGSAEEWLALNVPEMAPPQR
jgi:preprotein translocase subunit SecA